MHLQALTMYLETIICTAFADSGSNKLPGQLVPASGPQHR
jgi:hypothetical protein